MALNFLDGQRDLVDELGRHGLTMSPDALVPLQAIDFSRLVAIYDHEERFLRDVFLSSILTAYRNRMPGGGGAVIQRDVTTAMTMLGSAVAAADPQTFSPAHKPLIRDVCPYC